MNMSVETVLNHLSRPLVKNQNVKLLSFRATQYVVARADPGFRRPAATHHRCGGQEDGHVDTR